MAVCRYVRHKTNAELGRPTRTGLHVCMYKYTGSFFVPFRSVFFLGKGSIVHILDM